MVIILI